MFIESDYSHDQGASVAAFVDALALFEEIGYWAKVEQMLLSPMGMAIRARASEFASARILDIENKLKEAQAYELVHGAGSLKKKDHPEAIKWEAEVAELKTIAAAGRRVIRGLAP